MSVAEVVCDGFDRISWSDFFFLMLAEVVVAVNPADMTDILSSHLF